MREMSTDGIDMLKLIFVSSLELVASIVITLVSFNYYFYYSGFFFCFTALISISTIGIEAVANLALDYDYFSSTSEADFDFQ